jgi:hypothetical protein
MISGQHSKLCRLADRRRGYLDPEDEAALVLLVATHIRHECLGTCLHHLQAAPIHEQCQQHVAAGCVAIASWTRTGGVLSRAPERRALTSRALSASFRTTGSTGWAPSRAGASTRGTYTTHQKQVEG